MRARVKRKQRNRRILIISVFAVIVAVVILAAYTLENLNTGATSSPLDGTPIPSSLQQQLLHVATTYYGPSVSSLMSKIVPTNQTVWTTSPAKPIFVYIGAEFCPYCGFQRWPLTLALMRFGNLTGLAYEQSSASDFYHTATFTYLNIAYSSNYIVFEHYEAEDTNGNALQTVPSNYTSLWSQYDGGSEDFPMIIVNNQYEIPTAFYLPGNTSSNIPFNGDNWTQIANQLGTGTTISNEITASANALTAVICKVDGDLPAKVCGNSAISSLSPSLDAFHPGSMPAVSDLAYGGHLGQQSSPMQLLLYRKGSES